MQSNYNDAIQSPWNVGTGTMEQNGTFDMMGNVWEWNETLIGTVPIVASVVGRGTYDSTTISRSSSRYGIATRLEEYYDVGFRVASVPEPATLLLLGLGELF